jgi:hypothetical protein
MTSFFMPFVRTSRPISSRTWKVVVGEAVADDDHPPVDLAAEAPRTREGDRVEAGAVRALDVHGVLGSLSSTRPA